jgi:hypothetical protein
LIADARRAIPWKSERLSGVPRSSGRHNELVATPKRLNVLFIGNSFTAGNRLEKVKR